MQDPWGRAAFTPSATYRDPKAALDWLERAPYGAKANFPDLQKYLAAGLTKLVRPSLGLTG